MIARWKSALLLSITLFMAASIGVSAQPDGDSGLAVYRQASAGPGNTAQKDQVTLHPESNRLVVNVKHVTGIGGKKLHVPAGGWPGIVLVRLHDFPDVESFTTRAANAALDCARIRPEGAAPRLACRLGDAEIDAIRQEQGYFEVTLPPTLFTADGPVEIHWVDQWR